MRITTVPAFAIVFKGDGVTLYYSDRHDAFTVAELNMGPAA